MRESTDINGQVVRQFYNHDQFEQFEEDVRHDMRDSNIKQVRAARIGRNDPCPCGSGAKFKKCCIRLLPKDIINRGVIGGGK